MQTLKELRLSRGLNQSDIAKIISTNIPVISNYENGNSLPPLEDILTLEDHFKEKISFNETISPREKFDTIQCLIELFQRFPVSTVLEFGYRTYRRSSNPEKVIKFYADKATNEDQEPLINPNI